MKLSITLCTLLMISVLSLQAQQPKTITGRITDPSGNPLSYVNVVIKNSREATRTNDEGRFSLKVSGKEPVWVICTHFQYKAVEVSVDPEKNPSGNLTIVMEEQATSLEEVIITAEKKEATLQRTPIAVSALTSREIENRKITEVGDMVMAVPNLITMNAGSPTLNIMAIRGILTFSTDPAIGVYIDGIPAFDGYGTSMQLQDILRVEVLRGPQSTLYGRNALGGVINILTRQPGNTLRGFAEIGMGNLNAQEYRAGISSPLIKNKLFTSVNGFFTGRSGLITNEFDGKKFDDIHNYGGNFYLKYLPADRVSLVLNTKLEKNDITGTFPYPPNAQAALARPFTVNQNGSNIENRTLLNSSLNISYQLNKWELSSLTGFAHLNDIYDKYDQDYSPYDVILWFAPRRPQNTWTQELRVTSHNLDRWDIVGGLFGFAERREARTDTHFGADAVSMDPNAPYIYSSLSDQKGKGFAAYAHITYALTDKLRLTGGLRYDYDEKQLTLHDEYEKSPYPVQVFPSRTVSTSANALSPKINLAYLISDDVSVYANYAKGFRPGGVNQYGNAEAGYLTYQPEYTDNYEAGLKTEWLQNRLRANFAAYYTYWRDQQQTLAVPDFRILNIGEMYSRGVELELTALPVRNFEIRYNLGVVNTGYDKLLLTNEAGTDNADYEGNRQVFTPGFSSALSLSYTGTISKDFRYFVIPEWKYLGKQYMTYYNDLVQDPFHLLNANAGLRYKNYEIRIWAKNITDSRYLSFAYANYRKGNAPVALGLPQTYGVNLKVTF